MKQQTNYNKLVGRTGDEYYFCDYIFTHADDFKGATGSVLRPVSKAEYEERTSQEELEDRFSDVWREAVASGSTTDSLSVWVEQAFDIDGDEMVFDLSYSRYWDQLRELGFNDEEYPLFECTGGGRCFSKDIKFDEVYDQGLLNKIIAIES